MAATIQFKTEKKSGWVSGYDLEKLLVEVKDKIFTNKKALTIVIQARANAPINTLIRLINVANQLDHKGVKVTLDFSGKTNKLLGYCETMGFFECLSDGVKLKSPNGINKVSRIKKSGNSYISINKISGSVHDKSLPKKLAAKITDKIPNITEEQRSELYIQFFSLFSELTRNVCEHSQTELNGLAALQIYKNRAEIVVCDSGIGLLESLKPSLASHNAAYTGYSDVELILEMLTKGISSKEGDQGGNGLCTCFHHAKLTNSDMHIRLSETYYHFFKVADKPNLIDSLMISEQLLELTGTFISFAVPFNK
ncbi:hypothetical protein PULV_a2129 [Pseudoalteromonas ulvae UL12]|uniref:hypothetical protein n=1 Tax=Pseudoalteromonas ulvae TaxID=107327 RepID=UPI00186B5F0E|nr:hypothetical protein [Pseudoalteromonas ulvae]MBE0365350.1 hypothetical protein [Pseudoalteromonas ulvae UL12]